MAKFINIITFPYIKLSQMVEKTIEAMIFKNLEKLMGWVGGLTSII